MKRPTPSSDNVTIAINDACNCVAPAADSPPKGADVSTPTPSGVFARVMGYQAGASLADRTRAAVRAGYKPARR